MMQHLMHCSQLYICSTIYTTSVSTARPTSSVSVTVHGNELSCAIHGGTVTIAGNQLEIKREKKTHYTHHHLLTRLSVNSNGYNNNSSCT